MQSNVLNDLAKAKRRRTEKIQIGHFVADDQTVERGGFRAVFWDAPKDLRNAVEDIVVLLEYLRNLHRNIRQGTTSQLLVLATAQQCTTNSSNMVFKPLGGEDYECRPPHQLQVPLPSLLSLSKQGAAS